MFRSLHYCNLNIQPAMFQAGILINMPVISYVKIRIDKKYAATVNPANPNTVAAVPAAKPKRKVKKVKHCSKL